MLECGEEVKRELVPVREQLEEKLAELGGEVREGGQNRLTQDNWRSRGSSRGGPRPRPRGRSWKAGGKRSRGARGSWCLSWSSWRRPMAGVRA